MNEWLTLALALVAGLLLGAVFFGGLWWTVNKGVTFKHAALLFQASMLLRTVATVAGFYVVGGGDWRRLLACLLGFVIVRLLVIRLTAPPVRHHAPAKETAHATDT